MQHALCCCLCVYSEDALAWLTVSQLFSVVGMLHTFPVSRPAVNQQYRASGHAVSSNTKLVPARQKVCPCWHFDLGVADS